MTKGDRIRQLRERIGKSQTAFADMINVSKQTLYKYENDIITNIPSDKIEAIAEACNSTPAFIMGWTEKPITYKTAMIPLLSSVSAGTGCLATENIEGYVDIPEHLAKTGSFFALTVKGDSMEPDLHDRDIVIVRQQNDAETDEIVIAQVNGDEGFCKRLKKYDSGIALVSNNPAYAPLYFSGDDVTQKPVIILGKVVEARRKF